MTVTKDDFEKVWASSSPLTPYSFSESQYKEGWNFIGSTPPSRQMWDFLQKLTDEKIQYIYNNMIPVGIVQAFAGTTTPQGWLLCDGSAVSRTTYAKLFSVIGTTYGSGNGSTTFNLPNLVDKFIQGNSTSGTKKTAGLPNITGNVNMRGGSNVTLITADGGTGAIRLTEVDWTGTHTVWEQGGANPAKTSTLSLDASRSSSVYGNSTTVQPPALTMRYIIKY